MKYAGRSAAKALAWRVRGPALRRAEAQLFMFKDGQLAIEDQAVGQLVRCGDEIGKRA